MPRFWILFVGIFVLNSCFHKPTEKALIALNEGWELSSEIQPGIKVNLPATIQQSLFSQGIIPDPYGDQNFDSLQWIWDQNWVFTKRFSLPQSWSEYDRIEVNFPGLDTYADIFLNDSLIGRSKNAHAPTCVVINAHLQPGENILRVVIRDPYEASREEYSNWPFRFPAGNDKGSWKASSFVRKPGYHFGWDFAPRIIPGGITDQVYISGFSEALIENISFKPNAETGTVRSTVFVKAARAGKYGVRIMGEELQSVSKKFKLEKGMNEVQLDFSVPGHERWYPDGLGSQKLYNARVVLSSNMRKVDQGKKSFAFRSAKVLRERDSLGSSFTLEINGKRVFAKGGNMVPLDVFIDRIPEDNMRRYVQLLTEANFNMIRVWGGGRYQTDEFYELCDRHGIMVWQDFMFANTLNPWDEFLEQVENEVKHQVIRLADHPSIVLWCGNNEIDIAWKNWGWQKSMGLSPEDSAMIYSRYQYQFDSLIPGILQQYDSGAAYLSSTPVSNFVPEQGFNSGTIHDWAVWHGGSPIDIWTQRAPRFNAEFGMQSISSTSLLQKYSHDSAGLTSDFISSRQLASDGNERLDSYLLKQYRSPRSPEHRIYLSQIHQAMAIGEAAEFMRMSQPHCMGALIWQNNDCWPGISWSVIDYELNPKPAYHRIKKAFDPVMVYSEQENRRMKISLLNGRNAQLKAKALISRLNFFGTRLNTDTVDISLNPGQAMMLTEKYIGNYLDSGLGRWTLFQTRILEGEEEIHEDIHYMAKPRSLWLKQANVTQKISRKENAYFIELSSDFLVKDVWLESGNIPGDFERNHFDLIPNQPRVIRFIPLEPDEDTDLLINVSSLNDYR